MGICCLLIWVTLFVFLPVKGHDFIEYDDPAYVVRNSHVNTGLSVENILWAFTSAHSANWHPVTWLSHQLDCTLFGLDAGRHHLSSLVIHILNGIVLYFVLVHMTGSIPNSALVAFFFLVHPLRVESVAWVAERKDLLVGFFWMMTLLFYQRYVSRPTPGRYGWVMLFFVLGILSKPMIVTLPFVLLLLDVWPLGRFNGGQAHKNSFLDRPVVEKLPFMALTAASCLITYFVQQSAGAVGSSGAFPFNLRMGNALVSYMAYLKKMMIPSDLAVFYPHLRALPVREAVMAGIILFSITLFAFFLRKRYPYVLVGWLWYLGTLVPVIGIVQIGMQSMADRYTYIPMVGVLIAIVWGGDAIFSKGRTRRVMAGTAALVIMASCVWAAHRQVGYWRNSETLFTRTIAVTKGNYAIHTNLGTFYAGNGRTEEAIAQYRLALVYHNGFAKAHNNLAVEFAKIGNHNQALWHYHAALNSDPSFYEAHYNLGLALENQQQRDKAIHRYAEAVRIRPHFAPAHFRLGNLFAENGDAEKAAAHFQKALATDPEMVDARLHLGNVWLGQGKIERAVDQYRLVIRRKPDHAEAHNNLGIAWVRSRDFKKAVHHFRQALTIQPEDTEFRENLRKAKALVHKHTEKR